ncbi:hypothetical protein KB559_10840 [Paenibacillus sp. Marseille-P2973]|uniref:hypothetical protein n=1 Tax=Paenibacillus sp. Marseille-P2973 TaxID=1871032 RepID=UPI001B39C1DC|nr:hypothetical protein [Paenibacillus sp. Marseille-P2973]MBQ4899333.1 hypothetical protein [Paenibacillus sp. Marseille-P2973]
MQKEALEYLVELGNNEITEINGRTFSRHPLQVVKTPVVAPIVVRSLSGMVGYLQSEFDVDVPLMVHVESPTRVSVFSTVNSDAARNVFIQAEALLPEMRFGQWYDTEEFNIKLQSVFVNDGDRTTILKVVGNIQEENVSKTGDDGVSQKVTVKTGVATVADVIVPNPVSLYPFRTFVELQQPESLFVFRMKSGPACALFDADGGAWKVEAMDTIKDYLEETLSEQIADGKIVIIA